MPLSNRKIFIMATSNERIETFQRIIEKHRGSADESLMNKYIKIFMREVENSDLPLHIAAERFEEIVRRGLKNDH